MCIIFLSTPNVMTFRNQYKKYNSFVAACWCTEFRETTGPRLRDNAPWGRVHATYVPFYCGVLYSRVK